MVLIGVMANRLFCFFPQSSSLHMSFIDVELKAMWSCIIATLARGIKSIQQLSPLLKSTVLLMDQVPPLIRMISKQ